MSAVTASRPALAITALHVTYADGSQAVRGVGFELARGECLALVGESASGKSSIAMAVLGLLPATATVSGSIEVAGTQIVGTPEQEVRALRGRAVGLVAQDPYRAANPVMRVATNVAEAWRAHRMRPPPGAVDEALEELGILDAGARARARPHEWSGGMLQRASIAAAAAHEPPLLIADEPTSALDAELAHAILRALRARDSALLLVSHDLVLVAEHADRVAVCYAGRIVEHGEPGAVLDRPRHPYTRALIAATPRPGRGLPVPFAGVAPHLTSAISGCALEPRCPLAVRACRSRDPLLVDGVACPETR